MTTRAGRPSGPPTAICDPRARPCPVTQQQCNHRLYDAARWAPALSIGGETTPAQRQRNAALYRRLRDGYDDGDLHRSGLAGFVFDVPFNPP